MTESEIESFLQKAISVSLQYGNSDSIFGKGWPGQINIRFRREDAMDCIEFYRFVNVEFKDIDIRAFIKQTASDKIDITILIDKGNGLIISVQNLTCRDDKIEMFFKKNPKDKPLFLNIVINKPPDTIENMAILAEAEMEAGTNQPIMITSWDGTPLGTSS
jgi:hypothetical protein